MTAETAAKAAAIIDDAIALIVEPEHWTTRAKARDSKGELCDPVSPDAVQRCATGAYTAACHAQAVNEGGWNVACVAASEIAWLYLQNAAVEIGGVDIIGLNDRDPAGDPQIGGHGAVLLAMRLAAANLRQQAAAGDC